MVCVLNKILKWNFSEMKMKHRKAKRWSPDVTFKMKSIYTTDVFLCFPPWLQIRIFHAAKTFPPNISPSFTLTFCLKQRHACYHSKHAKGSFTEINNGRDFALLSHEPSDPLCCSPGKPARVFPDRPEGVRGRVVHTHTASPGKLNKY